jgi:hypothetical protein
LYKFVRSSNVSVWSEQVDDPWHIYSSVDISDDGKYVCTTQHQIHPDITFEGKMNLYDNIAETPLLSFPEDALEKIIMSNDGNYFFYSTLYDPSDSYLNFFNYPALTGWGYNIYVNLSMFDMSVDGKYQCAISADLNLIMLWSKDSYNPIWEKSYVGFCKAIDMTESGDSYIYGVDSNVIAYEKITIKLASSNGDDDDDDDGKTLREIIQKYIDKNIVMISIFAIAFISIIAIVLYIAKKKS